MPPTTVFRSSEGARTVHGVYQDLIRTHLPDVEPRAVHTAIGTTFVLSQGPTDAPPVLLLHGSGSVAASWAPVIAELSRRRRVHAIDLPGESGFTAPVRLPFEGHAHGRWLGEVALALRAEHATVAGLSLGAWVAIDYSVTHPDAVTDLFLFSPSGIGPRKVMPLLTALVLGTMGDPGRQRAVSHLLGPALPDWSDGFHQDLGALALLTLRHFQPRSDPLPLFTDDQIRSLPSALTVVLGERDRMLHASRAAQRLRGLEVPGRIDLLPGQGHLVPHHAYLRRLLHPRGRGPLRDSRPHAEPDPRTDPAP